MEGVQQKPLKYSIHACSSHSGASHPAHGSLYLLCSSFIHSGKYHGGPAIWSDIKVLLQSLALKPWLAVSRWSSDTNSPPQYLVLRWLTWKSNGQPRNSLQTGVTRNCDQPWYINGIYMENLIPSSDWRDQQLWPVSRLGNTKKHMCAIWSDSRWPSLRALRILIWVFKVLGGMEEDSMLDLLDSGLRNDNVTETFSVRWEFGFWKHPTLL